MKNILTLIFITICTTCFAGEIHPTIKTSTALPQGQDLSYATQSAWQVLLSYEGKDLSKLDKKSQTELQKSTDILLGQQKIKGYWGNEPRYLFFSKISNAQGQVNYILFDNEGIMYIPSHYMVHIHIFNRDGKFLDTSSFSCGWRVTKIETQITKMTEIGRDILLISGDWMDGIFPNGPRYKEYYALVDKKIMLLRLEENTKDNPAYQLIRNNYGPDLQMGLTNIGRSAEEWTKALKSNDYAEVLTALTWLGGIHLNSRNPPSLQNWTHENIYEAQVADELHSRKDVQEILQKLSLSSNPWVKEEATFAEKVEYLKR
jgi:hypothetical protein